MAAISDVNKPFRGSDEVSPKWQRFDYFDAVYGLKKDFLLKLIRAGYVRSSLITLHNSSRGVRVIDRRSVDKMLEKNANI